MQQWLLQAWQQQGEHVEGAWWVACQSTQVGDDGSSGLLLMRLFFVSGLLLVLLFFLLTCTGSCCLLSRHQ